MERKACQALCKLRIEGDDAKEVLFLLAIKTFSVMYSMLPILWYLYKPVIPNCLDKVQKLVLDTAWILSYYFSIYPAVGLSFHNFYYYVF